MEHDLSNVPAGWYPSPENPNLVRFWDGQQWTHSTAPAAPPTPAPQPPASAPTPTFAAQPTPPAPPAPTYAVAAPPAPPRANQPLSTKPTPTKKWLIGGAVVAGVLIVGSIGAAIGSGGRAPETQQPAALTEPSPTATPVTQAPPKESPTQAPPTTAAAKPPAEVNAVAFRAQANSHLDDMLKDLDDIVTTVEEDGFWRLISNVGELAFNQGQLEALDVPANVAKKWPAALVALDDAQDVLSEATSTEDDATILAAVKKMKAKVEAARVIADAAK